MRLRHYWCIFGVENKSDKPGSQNKQVRRRIACDEKRSGDLGKSGNCPVTSVSRGK